MNIKVGEKNYEIEFTFEAAESEIVNKVYDFFTGAYLMKNAEEIKDDTGKQVDCTLKEFSTIPKMAIEFLYMGLLEHHGKFGDIDQSVTEIADAKAIYKQFAKENPDDKISSHYELFIALRNQMEEDHFFKRVGVEQFMTDFAKAATETEKEAQKAQTKTTRNKKA